MEAAIDRAIAEGADVLLATGLQEGTLLLAMLVWARLLSLPCFMIACWGVQACRQFRTTAMLPDLSLQAACPWATRTSSSRCWSAGDKCSSARCARGRSLTTGVDEAAAGNVCGAALRFRRFWRG